MLPLGHKKNQVPPLSLPFVELLRFDLLMTEMHGEVSEHIKKNISELPDYLFPEQR